MDFSPALLLYSLDGRCEGPTPFIGQLASAPRCAATSLLLRSCTVVLTIKRWDAPRPVSLTRGFKGHTPFIRPVFETASAASCLCHQVRLGLLLIDESSLERSMSSALGIKLQPRSAAAAEPQRGGIGRSQVVVDGPGQRVAGLAAAPSRSPGAGERFASL